MKTHTLIGTSEVQEQTVDSAVQAAVNQFLEANALWRQCRKIWSADSRTQLEMDFDLRKKRKTIPASELEELEEKVKQSAEVFQTLAIELNRLQSNYYAAAEILAGQSAIDNSLQIALISHAAAECKVNQSNQTLDQAVFNGSYFDDSTLAYAEALQLAEQQSKDCWDALLVVARQLVEVASLVTIDDNALHLYIRLLELENSNHEFAANENYAEPIDELFYEQWEAITAQIPEAEAAFIAAASSNN